MKKTFFYLLFFAIPIAYSNAQIYNFEDGLVPTGFTSSSGNTSLSVSTFKYKLGAKSLKWDWKANEVLTANNPLGLAAASANGGIMLWIYNTAVNTQPLVFVFKNSAGVQKCTKTFNMNFVGWRCFNATFATDMLHDKTALASMNINAPTTGLGTIYFDYLQFQTSVDWSRISDTQYTVAQNLSLMCDFLTANNTVLSPTAAPTAIQIQSADTITKRLDDWHVGSGAFSTSPILLSRKNSIKSSITAAKTFYSNLNLTTQSDGAVIGNGLFSENFPDSIDGFKANNFSNVSMYAPIPLAYDFRFNGTPASKTALINYFDYLNDQGWAAGSGLSSLYFQNIGRSVGYYHSLFMMRNELDSTRLNRELNTVKWYGLFGDVLTPVILSPRGVDNMRSILIAKFVYALLQPDPKLKVAGLTALRDYCNKVFLPSPGYWDNFKPDYTGYAHGGPYMAAYFGDALSMACFSYYLLHNTPYALSDAVFQQLKNCLLTHRIMATLYNTPMSINGRFPISPDWDTNLVASFAYLGLSQPTPDAELLAAFGRLWQPTNASLSKYIARSSVDITYKASVGEIELCLKAAALSVAAEPSPRKQVYFPYGGLLVSRDAINHVSVKGFSKYIWDYETILPNDNVYGRYLNYGHIEYTSLADGRKNDAATDISWDWSRIPGTTVKYQDAVSLAFKSNLSQRNFSDSPYLGGVALNDSTSMFSMKLHDNYFDTSFYANKSVFCFGNTLVCLGSNIQNADATVQTETTLFQQTILAGETMKVNNSACVASTPGFVNPIINDNIGNCYLVKDGTVDMVKTGNLFTSYINHGKAPSSGTYEYYMMLKPNTAQVTKYTTAATMPISIIRKDTIAHIVNQKEQNVFAYAIFNTSTPLNDTYIQQVNSPSMVMMKNLAQGAINLMVSDPDMRRQTAAYSDAITPTQKSDTGKVFNYQMTLNGLYMPNGLISGAKLTYGTSTTIITIPVRGGKTFAINLKPLVSGQIIYVDPVNGSDTNDGYTWQTTVKSLSTASTLAIALPGVNNIFVKGGCTLSYPSSTLSLSGDNFYGGFQGTELTIADRPLVDLDGNGIIDPWEFKYPTIINSTFNGNAFTFTSASFNGFTISHTGTNSTSAMTTISCDPNTVFENNIVKNCVLNLTTGTNTLGGILFRAQGLVQNCLLEKNKVTINMTNGTGDKAFVPIMDAIAGVKVNACVFRNNNVVIDATATTAGPTTYCKGLIVNVSGGINPSAVSVISNCLIYNNEATYTGGGGTSTATLINGCMIGTNGFSTSTSSDSIVNCTVANNKVTNIPTAGLTVNKVGSLVHTVLNNLFWNNQSAGVVKNIALSATISSGRIGYNMANGGSTGTFTTATLTTDNIFDLANVNSGVLNSPCFTNPTTLIGCVSDGSVEIANWKPLLTSYLLGKGVTTTKTYDKSGNMFLSPRSVGAYEYSAPLTNDIHGAFETESLEFLVHKGGIQMCTQGEIQIVSISGMLVKQSKCVNGEQIDLPSGVYIIKIKSEVKESVHKIVI